jgi:hypothetical protein
MMGGELRGKARALHHGNGDDAGGDRVGDGRAGDRAHEPRAHHRHHAGAASEASGQQARQLDDELAGAGLEQERPEQDEHEHIGGRDVGRAAEHALGAEEAAVEHGFQAQPWEGEQAGNVAPQEQDVGQRQHDQHGREPARGAPGELDGQQHGHARDHIVGQHELRFAGIQRVLEQDQIGRHQQGRHGKRHVDGLLYP